jgi:hypothetical protein
MRGKAHRLGHNFRPGFLKYTVGHKVHRNPHSTGLIWLAKVDLLKKYRGLMVVAILLDWIYHLIVYLGKNLEHGHEGEGEGGKVLEEGFTVVFLQVAE